MGERTPVPASSSPWGLEEPSPSSQTSHGDKEAGQRQGQEDTEACAPGNGLRA